MIRNDFFFSIICCTDTLIANFPSLIIQYIFIFLDIKKYVYISMFFFFFKNSRNALVWIINIHSVSHLIE